MIIEKVLFFWGQGRLRKSDGLRRGRREGGGQKEMIDDSGDGLNRERHRGKSMDFPAATGSRAERFRPAPRKLIHPRYRRTLTNDYNQFVKRTKPRETNNNSLRRESLILEERQWKILSHFEKPPPGFGFGRDAPGSGEIFRAESALPAYGKRLFRGFGATDRDCGDSFHVGRRGPRISGCHLPIKVTSTTCVSNPSARVFFREFLPPASPSPVPHPPEPSSISGAANP